MLPLTMHRKITKGVRLAIRARLQLILEEEQSNYERWQGYIAPKMQRTKAKTVERAFKKRIQAFRIVIYVLTPREMRDTDIPNLFNRES